MSEPLHLLVLNGNTSSEMTHALTAQTERLLPPGVRATVQGVSEGPAYIGDPLTVAEAAIAINRHVAAELARPDAPRWSAAVLACFGEPGLAAMRMQCPFPVVGMAEASAHAAMQFGGDFAIATPGALWPHMLKSLYHELGLDQRLGEIAAVPGPVRTLDSDPEVAEEVWAVVTRLLERQPGAVIVGGAALTGVAAQLQKRTETPLVDSFAAALGQATGLAITRSGGQSG